MEENKILTLRQPGEVADPLTEVLRNARAPYWRKRSKPKLPRLLRLTLI